MSQLPISLHTNYQHAWAVYSLVSLIQIFEGPETIRTPFPNLQKDPKVS